MNEENGWSIFGKVIFWSFVAMFVVPVCCVSALGVGGLGVGGVVAGVGFIQQASMPVFEVVQIPWFYPTAALPSQQNQDGHANNPPETNLFGEGYCEINGVVYVPKSDPSAVWLGSYTLHALSEYGGTCRVTTYKHGWYWSDDTHGSITLNGQPMEPGNQLYAPPGDWVIVYPALKDGESNESYGFTFRDNIPEEADNVSSFATGYCVVDGKTTNISVDDGSAWLDHPLLGEVWKKGGKCTVTLFEDGLYWSIAGKITHDGKEMTNNNSGYYAPAGVWVFDYPERENDSHGFVFHKTRP